MIRSLLPLLAAATLLLAIGTPSSAQKKKADPGAPTGPNLGPLAITGVQRGQSIELTLTGANLAHPTGLSLGTNIEASFLDKDSADAGKQRVKVTVPADAPVGAYPLRLATTAGVSNLRLFCVDDLPQVAEAADNHGKKTPQSVPAPCVVMGKVESEQADWFKIDVKAGQRLSFDLLGRRLGSTLDAQLTVYEGKSQRQVAYDNDSPGCQGDPRLSVTFKEAGAYLIEVKDVLNRGGADFFYRLRIGDFPLATTPLPLAARRKTHAKIGFAGPAVEGVAPVELDVPETPQIGGILVHPRGPAGLHGWPVTLLFSDHDELVEQEPNNEPAKATRLPVPAGVTGRFAEANDTDCYVVTAKKGQKLVAEVATLELGSPTLVLLVVRNAKTGAEIGKSNPQAASPADQRLEFIAPEDGDVVLEVQHLYLGGGPSEVYRLTVMPAVDFDLNFATERVDASPGTGAAVVVQAVRRGYAGPIELSLQALHSPPGAPALAGSASLKPGQGVAVIPVPLPDNAPLGAFPFAVVGRGGEMTRLAGARAALSQNLGGLPYPPPLLQDQAVLGVRPKPPFALAVKLTPPEAVPGIPVTVTVAATREAGFAGEIVLSPPGGLPPNVPAPKMAGFPKGKDEVSFALDTNAKTPMGDFVLLLTARAHAKDQDVAVTTPLPLHVGRPFDLTVEPGTLLLKPGAKAKLKINAQRRGGYQGPIAVTVKNLPANVTAPPAAIAMKQDSVEVEIAAADNAAPGEKLDVEVAGTASALNNLAAASPAFAVRVEKK